MAERIKERRKAMGYTQTELGEKLGLQASAIAKYENGRVKNMKRSVIANMAKVLECSPTYLMGLDDNITTNKNTFNLVPLEKEIITRYRQADEISKAMVRKALDIDEQLFSGKEGTA